MAEDTSAARRELANPDFRVRVSAALALGKTHDLSVRLPLEQLLADPNPAVRSAAAAALGVLGDPAAVAALDRAQTSETSASVKSQMGSSSEGLKRVLTLQGVQVVVQIGSMRNGSGVRGDQLADVLRGSAGVRARTMSNVLVAGPQDSALLQRAADKHVPVMLLDGFIVRVVQGQAGGNITVQAQVEFSMRKVPDQTLKGTLTGGATSVGSPSTNPLRLAQLQDQAVDGAVESALRGADRGLVVAAR